MAKTSAERPFLIQIYFVLATLLSLMLIVIGAVNGARLGLNALLGVQSYPEFSAPYPPFEKSVASGEEGIQMTPEQAAALEQWSEDYARWQEEMRDYNAADQQQRREISQFVAMLLVGVPLFALHAPSVLSKG